jgi:hypothetical protein
METSLDKDHPSNGTRISLRIWHPSMPSEEITKAIGLSPSLHNDVGAPRTTPDGQALKGIYTSTYWLYKFSLPINTEVEDCITKALELLSLKREFLKHIAATGGHGELFIGVFLKQNLGIELDGKLVRQVSDTALGLSFDVYGQAEDVSQS